jgi:hypothetical protein
MVLCIFLPVALSAGSEKDATAAEVASKIIVSAEASGATQILAKKDSETSQVMLLRRLEVAKNFLLEPPENKAMARGTVQRCRTDGAELQPILVTTYGAGGSMALWQQYPLALEAWICPLCQSVTYPAYLSHEQAKPLLDEAVAAGRAGNTDAAEFALRRILGASPNHATARVNLGSVFLDRARQAEKSGASRGQVIEYKQMAIEQFEKSLHGDAPPPHLVHFMLGNVYMSLGDRARGRVQLQAYLGSPTAREPFAAEARRLLAE